MNLIEGVVTSVNLSKKHAFSKSSCLTINLIAGIGVEGDAHAGRTVKHRYLVGKNPNKVNIRQVHLMHSELFDEVNRKGFDVKAGDLGENITTRGVDLLKCPTNTKLFIGSNVVIQLTALRNPCSQIDRFQECLLKELVYYDCKGNVVCKAGVMGVVLVGGLVQAGDAINVNIPNGTCKNLEYVW